MISTACRHPTIDTLDHCCGSDGLQLLRNGRDLMFLIVPARRSMPRSICKYSERCDACLATGPVPSMPVPLPA